MRGLKTATLVMILAAMLWVWPIHPFREVGSVRSGDEGHSRTAPLKVGESVTQYFTAEDDNIIQIEFVLSYDDTLPREGELLFELLDPKGDAVYETVLDYAGIADYSYGGPAVNVRVRRGKRYAYRLTNESILANEPCGVYTTEDRMRCLKKGRMEAGGAEIDGELLTRVTSNKPLTAANTAAIWGCIGMVGFSLYEALSRREKSE